MSTVVMVTTPPYGSEGPFNALRLAEALVLAGQTVDIVLMGDAVTTARSGQDPATAHASLEPLLSGLIEKGAGVALCGTCCRSRGLDDADLVDGAQPVTIHDIARLVASCDKVVSF
jgi:sulfur relay (sulfurtransferase) complex TusBCD TusD component (DsrE family)